MGQRSIAGTFGGKLARGLFRYVDNIMVGGDKGEIREIRHALRAAYAFVKSEHKLMEKDAEHAPRVMKWLAPKAAAIAMNVSLSTVRRMKKGGQFGDEIRTFGSREKIASTFIEKFNRQKNSAVDDSDPGA